MFFFLNQHTFCKHNGFKLEMCYVTIQNVIKKTNFRLKDIVSLRHSFIYLDYVHQNFLCV